MGGRVAGRKPPAAIRLAAALALLATALAFALFAVRLGNAISFAEPLQLVTAGAEHDALFAIWKQIQGLPVYSDRHRIPFAASNYNWLFFEGYGWIAGAVLRALSLADAWLPTVTRLITVALCAFGAVLLHADYARAFAPRNAAERLLVAAFALWFFFGPLAGFWAIATNVEFAATVFLIASFYAFDRLYPARPLAAVVVFSVLAYATWAMKQNYVYGAGAVGLYLLLRRDWRPLALLVVLLPAAWGATLLAGSETYAKMILFRGTDITLSPATALRNLGNAGGKTLAAWLGLAGLAAAISRRPAARRALLGDRRFALYALGLAVSLVMVVPMSAMIGAAENYYFPVVYFAAGTLLAGLGALRRAGVSAPWAWRGMSAGWGLGALAVLAVLTGFAGAVSTRQWHDRYMAIKACLDRLPAPAFTVSAYNHLPWMYSKAPNFVIAFKYRFDRADGVAFERGGLGGLIAQGYFAALMMDKGTETFDGTPLRLRYAPAGKDCAGSAVWLRRDRPRRPGGSATP